MPYHWTKNEAGQPDLRLWPHRSLPRRGFGAMVLLAFGLGILPLFGLLGSATLWGVLPFILLMVAGLWWGLQRSYRDADMGEDLHREGDQLILTHRPVKGAEKCWTCNIYWARVVMHISGGPVPHYVTLTGNGHEVEIGRFLSEEERKTLFGELTDFLKQAV